MSTKAEREHAVERIESTDNLLYQCQGCGQVWAAMIRPGGHKPRGWWRCPNGCNSEGGEA